MPISCPSTGSFSLVTQTRVQPGARTLPWPTVRHVDVQCQWMYAHGACLVTLPRMSVARQSSCSCAVPKETVDQQQKSQGNPWRGLTWSQEPHYCGLMPSPAQHQCLPPSACVSCDSKQRREGSTGSTTGCSAPGLVVVVWSRGVQCASGAACAPVVVHHAGYAALAVRPTRPAPRLVQGEWQLQRRCAAEPPHQEERRCSDQYVAETLYARCGGDQFYGPRPRHVD